MKRVFKILFRPVIFGLIILVLFAVVALGVLPSFADSDSDNPLESIRIAGINFIMDLTGVKTEAISLLKDNISSISEATGLSEADCTQILYSLDIDSWEVAILPSSATATGSYSGTIAGINGTVTLYDDPEYITLVTDDQTITMKIPESAQVYLSYLSQNW